MVCFKVIHGGAKEPANLYELMDVNNRMRYASVTEALQPANIIRMSEAELFVPSPSLLVGQEEPTQEIKAGNVANMGYLSGCTALVAFNKDKTNLRTFIYHAPGGKISGGGTILGLRETHYIAYIIPHTNTSAYKQEIESLIGIHKYKINDVIIVTCSDEKNATNVFVKQDGSFYYL